MTATVTGVALDVGHHTLAGQGIVATLTTSSYELAAGGELVLPEPTRSAADGTWSITLVTADELLVPTGAYYTISVGRRHYTAMPPTAGTYQLKDILVGGSL